MYLYDLVWRKNIGIEVAYFFLVHFEQIDPEKDVILANSQTFQDFGAPLQNYSLRVWL